MDEMTLVIAHRGAWGRYGENTLDAFEEAVRIGADMIELDVRRAGDGRLIARHDAAGDKRYDELGAPLLCEVVAQFEGRIALNLELKERGCEEEAIALLGEGPPHLITSFHEDVVRQVKRRAQIRTGLVVADASAEDPLTRARRCGADRLVLEAGLKTTAEIPCLVWTVNEAAEIDRCLLDPAVAGVITDRPELALARRAQLSARTERAARR